MLNFAFNIWEIVGILGASFASAFFLIKYFSEKIFESYLQRSLEKYKKGLERVAFVHQIQYSSLHKERAEVIKNIYSKLYDFKETLHRVFLQGEFMSNDRLGDNIEDIPSIMSSYREEYAKNVIYFSDDLANKFETIYNSMYEICEEVYILLEKFDGDDSDDNLFEFLRKDSNEGNKIKLKIINFTTNEYSVMIRELEAEFRKVLGVE